MPKITPRGIMIILILIIPLIWHFFIGDYFYKIEDNKRLMSGYKGIIAEKGLRHVRKIRIKTKNDIETILSPSSELWDNASIGDSLIKISGEDSVILIKNGVQRKLLYD